jgi:CIC family chloride channel protein
MPPQPTETTSERLRRGQIFMVAVAIVVGAGGGFGAVVLHKLIHIFQAVFYDAHGSFLEAVEAATPWRRVAMTSLGGLIVGPLVYFFAREAKGHGVPEVMESIILRGGTIRPRVVVVKALASAITIASGGSAGREGPIVQIGSALGSTLGQLLRVSTSQLRTLVGCGASAGIAAAFNAPIAGALFAVEILLGDFGVPQFSPIVISSVVATVVSRRFLGDSPALKVPPHELISPFELLTYMIAGVVAGLVGLAFIRTLAWCESFFEGLPTPPEYLKAMLGGALVGIIGIFLPQVFGSSVETIHAALTGTLPVALLGALLVAKILATSITLSSGGSGGVFAPSLFLGAMTGGFLGNLFHWAFPAYTAGAGAYALVTMGAVVAAATHAPITAIIIIFELTGDYRIIAPLMAACVVSTLVASWLEADSIYTIKLTARGIDLNKKEEANVLKELYVRDIVDREPVVIPASASFAALLDLVVQSPDSEFFVVNNRQEYLGAVSLSQVRRLIFEGEDLKLIALAGDLVDPTRPTVREDDNLDVVMRLFSLGNYEALAVVDSQDSRRLLGIVRQRDVIHARNRAIHERDLAGSVSSTFTVAGRVHQVDVGDGCVVQEIPAPHSFLGRSLRELDMRARYGVQVVFVRSRRDHSGSRRLEVPTPDTAIQSGDTLIIAGAKAAADRLETSA